MRLTVVRHGRTAWNLEGRFQGNRDVPLDEEGRAQARAAGLRLRGDRFDRIVSSDLLRALETARIIAGDGRVIESDARWREMSFGAWEGLTWPEIEERFPEQAPPPGSPVHAFMPPGGESFEQLCARIARAATVLETCREGEAMLVVTHAGPIHALLRVLGVAPGGALGLKILPASISRLHRSGAGWTIEALNTVDGPVAGGTEFLRGADNAPE
jgi:broad specificity phosphatase PhoE